MLAYKPMPSGVTQPIMPPPAPPRLCLSKGRAVPCIDDALATIPGWQAALKQCNADRRLVDLLGATDAIH